MTAPNRKFLCTLSLFLCFLALFVGGWFVRLPDYYSNWCCPFTHPKHDATLPLAGWLFVYIVIPLGVLGIALGTLYELWLGCAAICAKLRGEKNA